MSDTDAKEMMRRCFTEESEGLQRSFLTHQEAMQSYKVYVEKLDYLWQQNREISLMGANSIARYLTTQQSAFRRFEQDMSRAKAQRSKEELKKKASIKKLRDSNILYTVLGQKILFFAVSRFLLRINAEQRISETLNAVSRSITKMDKDGFFGRDQFHWSNVLVRPNENLTMITTGSGYEKCVELVRMILSDSSEGVRKLIESTKDEVSNEVKWNEPLISTWRKDFHVILPEVELPEEQIKASSESDDSFTEVRDVLDFFEEEEEESDEIEDDEDIFQETEEVKD
ncbi:hypothetical protein [Dendronalium sp. ChiSLP03b]|uniref:hypothetical protein n=1 Tax=Dendronalium sp. ChiSLP03b TaxID=3075381 RepID=UPI002AD2EA9A|nr:hypothetical protein [Dendronalium sp. ChiSLP03b]MDZ8204674.1 hypothetical protein [Dendronalium sp. ChiSLP03b]